MGRSYGRIFTQERAGHIAAVGRSYGRIVTQERAGHIAAVGRSCVTIRP